MADIDTSKVTSSFAGGDKPDAKTAAVRKRFNYEADNHGIQGAVKRMDSRNALRDEARKRDFNRNQKAQMMSSFPATVSHSAMMAAGSRTTTATIDGIRGILRQWFRDGEVVREEFSPI